MEMGSWMESKTTAKGWGLEVEGLCKKEKGLMDMDNSIMISGRKGI